MRYRYLRIRKNITDRQKTDYTETNYRGSSNCNFDEMQGRAGKYDISFCTFKLKMR